MAFVGLYFALSSYAPKKLAPAEAEVDWAAVAACFTGGLLLLALIAIAVLAYRDRRQAAERMDLQARLARAEAELEALRQRFHGVVDADAERQRVLGGISAEVATLQAQRQGLAAELQAARQQATNALHGEVAQLCRRSPGSAVG